MLSIALLGAALAAPLPPPTDLDGDGKPERFAAGAETAIQVGATSYDCGPEPGGCQVSVVDVKTEDKRKEVLFCWMGPRDDRQCELTLYEGGKLVALEFKIKGESWWPAAVEVPGTGIVYVDSVNRVYTRRDKFTLAADGRTLAHTPQPFYNAGTTLRVDRSFAITSQPGAGATVANAKPGSEVLLLLESGDRPDHFLVRLSSGLVGWASLDALLGASDALKAAFSAG